MKTWKVTIDFKKGPSFCPELQAASEFAAKGHALILARQCGYMERAKKITALEAV